MNKPARSAAPVRRVSSVHVHACGVAVLALCAGAGYVFGIRPAQARAASIAAGNEQVQAAGREIEQSRDRRSTLERDIARLEERLAAEAVADPPVETLNERLLRLSKTAASHGLTVISSEDGGEVARELYVVRLLTLSGTGGYAEVAHFASGLLAEFPDVRVVGLSVRASGSDASGPSFRIDLAWYRGSAG